MPEPDHHEAQEHALDDAIARAKVSPWTLRQKIGRALWMVVQGTLFRYSWHNWYAFRRALLRLFGARIGRSVSVRPTARIEIPWLLEIGDYCSVGDFARVYNLGPITIGRRVSVSQYAHLCAGSHDHTRADLPLTRPPIAVHDNAWLAAECFVGPGVTVGEGAILGARGCAFKDLAPWTIYGGNPARAIGHRSLQDGDPGDDA